MATMGYIRPEVYKWSGFPSPAAGLEFRDILISLAAVSKVPGVGWLQITLWYLHGEATGGLGYSGDG